MCGIIGVIDKEEQVFNSTVIGLMSLQHRGQDSGGIVTCDGDTLFEKKEMGAVHNIFKPEDGNLLKGTISIGQTRYATQGIGTVNDAQPLCSDTNPKISLTQNGNMVNYFDLKDQFNLKAPGYYDFIMKFKFRN